MSFRDKPRPEEGAGTPLLRFELLGRAGCTVDPASGNVRRKQSKVKVIDRRMRGGWEKKGGEEIHERALVRAREILATHEVPPLPQEALRVFEDVKRRVG
jgi:hypothetical protein